MLNDAQCRVFLKENNFSETYTISVALRLQNSQKLLVASKKTAMSDFPPWDQFLHED